MPPPLAQTPLPTDAPGSLKSAAGPIALLAFIFFLNFTTRTILSPLLPTVEQELGLSHAEAGSIYMFLSIGVLISVLASGFVSARLQYRGAIILSTMCAGAALVFVGLGQSILQLRLAVFCLGLAGGLYFPSGVALITGLVKPSAYGRALAIHEMAPNLSYVCAPLVVELLLARLSWRGTLFSLALAAVAAGTIFAIKGTSGRQAGEAPSRANIIHICKNPSLWIMILVLGLGVAAAMGVFAMMPLFLIEEGGLSRRTANVIVSLSRLSGLGISFFGGWFSDRIGQRKALAIMAAATGALTASVGLTKGVWLIICVVAQPAAVVCLLPPAIASLSRLEKPALRPLVVSVCMAMATVFGNGVIPQLMGWLADRDLFSLGFYILGSALPASALLVAKVRFHQPESEAEPVSYRP